MHHILLVLVFICNITIYQISKHKEILIRVNVVESQFSFFLSTFVTSLILIVTYCTKGAFACTVPVYATWYVLFPIQKLDQAEILIDIFWW